MLASPCALTDPDCSSSSPLDRLALRGEAAAPALVLRDRIMTFAELEAAVARLAGWLRAQVEAVGPGAGVQPSSDALPGARIASWAAKGLLTCLLPLAAPRAGLVHVPINPLLKRAQVAHILADSGAVLLLGTPARLASLAPGDLPEATAAVAEDDALAAMAWAPGLGPSAAAANDLAAILYTSGSTGLPKGVMLSHANLWLGAGSVASYLGLAGDDRTLAVLPLAFDYGQNQLLSSWYAGASVMPLDYLAPADVIKAVARYRITTLAGVPPLWVQLVERAWPLESTMPLRRLTNSGGALTPALVRQLRALFPDARIFAMYGLTEAFRSTFLAPELIDANPTAIGQAIPCAEILVVDEAGEVCGDGVEGELVHCGPLVAQGYWRDDARTRERFRPAPAASRHGGAAVWSGDRVRRGGDGLLYFVGRRDAMIKTAGNRISPQEIEDAALATGLVTQAVALGVADRRLCQAVHLVVRGDAETEPALRERMRDTLANFMQPQTYHWVETLPVGPNGKLDRQQLLAAINAGAR